MDKGLKEYCTLLLNPSLHPPSSTPPLLSPRSLHTPPPPHSVYPFTFIVLDVDLIVQCPRNLPQIINVGIRFTNVWKISQQNYNFNLGFTGFREIVIFSLNLQSFYMSGSNHAICYNYVIRESVYVQYIYLFEITLICIKFYICTNYAIFLYICTVNAKFYTFLRTMQYFYLLEQNMLYTFI